MTKIIVSKFGGTSMGDADCMLRSAEVSLKRNSNWVVVSATSGTTNDLILLTQLALKNIWSETEALLLKIKNRHNLIAQELNVDQEKENALSSLYDEMESLARGIFLLRDCSDKALDAMMSLGERMSSILFTQALANILKNKKSEYTASLVDVRKILKTDDSFGKARPQSEKINSICKEFLAKEGVINKVFVTQGFIGQTEEGATTTLGRGGSDYSAALLAEGLGANVLEIWTDVAGIATTDPRICPNAKAIADISFKEASELATFGAKILHPATLLPAIRKNIPVFVGSSFSAESLGTWINKEAKELPLIRAIALRKNQALVTLTTPEMLHAHGFLFKIFEVFNRYQVSIDAITTSEVSVSMTLDESAIENKKLIFDLEKFAEVHVEKNLCLVALVGNNIHQTPGLAKKIFEVIPDINVRMICHGASKHNFCFIVSEHQGVDAVQRLHQKFIETF